MDAQLSAAGLGISGPARRGIRESGTLDDLPEFLTVEEAAAVLRIGRTAAYQLTRRWRASNGTEGLPVRKLGRLLPSPGPCSCMLICMQTTSVRIDGETHDELKRLAAELGTTVGRTVTLAVRALRQDRVGEQLAQPLRADETAWLDAELG